MPFSIFASMTTLPGSMTSRFTKRLGNDAFGAAIRLRLTNLVFPPSG
jgi:hypothetical protein